MQEEAEPGTKPVAESVFVSDREMARILGVSVQLLQKDRTTAKRIPVIRLGDRCLYDPPAVLDAVRAMTVGGNTPNAERMRRRPRGQR